METRYINRIVVCHRPEWQKWPDTEDRDYSLILSHRTQERLVSDDGTREVIVTSREWPVFHSWMCSTGELPYRYPPHLDNTVWPSSAVSERQIADLKALRDDGCDVLLWEHSYGCHPPTAEALPAIFPLRILSFSDDCPGSGEARTYPVAAAFNVYVHGMYLISMESGERVAAKYRSLGVERCYFLGNNPTNGLVEWTQQNSYTIERRCDDIWSGAFLYDLVFIGGCTGAQHRTRMLTALNSFAATNTGGVRLRLHGVGMHHGVLEPRDGQSDGLRAAPVYAQSAFGVNPQWSSLFNTRLLDLWYMGVVQIVYDPHAELMAEGFRPDEHFLAYDGTPDGLLNVVKQYRERPKEMIRIARAAHDSAVAYRRRKQRLMADIYFDHWPLLSPKKT